MLKSAGFTMLTAICIGCSNQNQVTILNHAQEQIMFNFRAEAYTVGGRGDKVVIDDIPNGTYTYGTTYRIPAGTKTSTADANCSGTLTFSNRNTSIHFTYSSVFDDSSGAYSLGTVWTSDNSSDNPVSQ